MKRFVVGTYNLFDNTLDLQIVTAVDWKSAVEQVWTDVDFSKCDDDIGSWQAEAFNGDQMFNVLELP